MIQDGYSICFNEWALDKRIKNELGLLLIISSLCAAEGYCYAKNEYFAELFSVDEVSISRKIKKLIDYGYLEVEYKKRGAEILERHLRLTKMLTDDYQKQQPTINKNVKDKTIIIKNKIFKNNTARQKEVVEKSVDYGDKIRIGGEFMIDLTDEYFYPYRFASNQLLKTVERWLIKNKQGQTINKSFICRQIANFAKKQGCYDELLGSGAAENE